MPENPVKIGVSSMFCVKMMLIPGAVPFSDLRRQKKGQISVQEKMSRKMVFLGRIQGGERFGSEKGRWTRTQFPYIYIYIYVDIDI